MKQKNIYIVHFTCGMFIYYYFFPMQCLFFPSIFRLLQDNHLKKKSQQNYTLCTGHIQQESQFQSYKFPQIHHLYISQCIEVLQSPHLGAEILNKWLSKSSQVIYNKNQLHGITYAFSFITWMHPTRVILKARLSVACCLCSIYQLVMKIDPQIQDKLKDILYKFQT